MKLIINTTSKTGSYNLRSQYSCTEQLNNQVFLVEKDTDKQKLKSPHTSAIGRMHQAALSGHAPLELLKVGKLTRLIVLIACNKTRLLQ